MDKNTIAGLVIIFLILIGFSYLTRPSKEQVAEMQRKQDSIARVDRLRAQELAVQQQARGSQSIASFSSYCSPPKIRSVSFALSAGRRIIQITYNYPI